MTIIKRSGKIEKLTSRKIFDSICNANACVSTDEQLTHKQIKRITVKTLPLKSTAKKKANAFT